MKNGRSATSREAGCAQVVEHVVEPVLARVQVEDELLLGEGCDVLEERAPVARVVDRAEDRRRGDGRRRDVVVQVAELDRSAIAESCLAASTISGGRVDSAVAKATREQQLSEAAVAAGEVEYLVARHELGPSADDEIGAVREVASPRRRRRAPSSPPPARVLVVLHSASRRSGCLRTKRAIPRACQSVCRERNLRSITAA